MGTKTADETGAETGAETTTDEQKAGATDLTKTDEVTPAGTGTDADADAETETDADAGADDLGDEAEPARAESAGGVGQGAAAVVSAALGLVSLTGSWLGTVAAARENLVGQLENSQTSDIATLVSEGYGDGWNVTALYGGAFALVALVVGALVLIRPAFGAPREPQAAWIKSVSWAGVALGVIGLLLAVLKYTDVLVGLPSTS
jgi:hypothetical protein